MALPFEQVEEALALYTLTAPNAVLIRHNENITYKVTDAYDGKLYLLRIHRPIDGFSTGIYRPSESLPVYIQSELEIISALKSGTDIMMQTPVAGKNGTVVTAFSDGTPVTLLQWVNGETLEHTEMTQDVLSKIGKTISGIHQFFAQKGAAHYTRYRYDQSILPLIIARLESAVKSDVITGEQGQTVISAVHEMGRRFDALDKIQAKHIVHSDLSKSNLLLNVEGNITPIDFSLCGYSHFYQDLGGLFASIEKDNDRRCLIDSYKTYRNIAVEPYYIEPYFALQVILFIASQYERASEWDWYSGAMDRWCSDIFKPLIKKTAFLLV